MVAPRSGKLTTQLTEFMSFVHWISPGAFSKINLIKLARVVQRNESWPPMNERMMSPQHPSPRTSAAEAFTLRGGFDGPDKAKLFQPFFA